MSDQENQKNPLLHQPIGMEDYAAGKPEAKAVMDKIFTTFKFTRDFERAYQKDGFVICRFEQGKVVEDKKQFPCSILVTVGDEGAITTFMIDFSKKSTSNQEWVLDKKGPDEDILALRHSHLLVVGPKNYKDNQWTDWAYILNDSGYSFSILDNNPENNSFFATRDGKKISGACTVDELVQGQLQLNDPDSFALYANDGKTRYSFKYSYIPFDKLAETLATK